MPGADAPKPVPIMKFTHNVLDRDVDFRKEMTLASLMCYLQDAAGYHSTNLGANALVLAEENKAWILMRLRVDIERMPTLYEEFTLETWPQKASVHYERDFLLRDMKGKVIVRAVTMWIIMNVKEREILRDAEVDYGKIELISERAIKDRIVKVKTPGKSVYAMERPITYSLLDFNRHLNNTKYMDLMMDCLGMHFLEKNRVDRVEINFIHEVLEGDTLVLGMDRSQEEDGVLYVEGGSRKDQRTSFRAKLHFTKADSAGA